MSLFTDIFGDDRCDLCKKNKVVETEVIQEYNNNMTLGVCNYTRIKNTNNDTRNYKNELQNNYSRFQKTNLDFNVVEQVCGECYRNRKLIMCEVTNKIILNTDNVIKNFNNSEAKLCLTPYHHFSSVKIGLSKEGLEQIGIEHKKVLHNIDVFIGGTKNLVISGYTTIKELGIIKATHNDILSVEKSLKCYSAQLGGNAYVSFSWDRNTVHHEEPYVAGYGPKGNPYYRTKRSTSVKYSGVAKAVILEQDSNGKSSQQSNSRKPNKDDHKRGESYYAKILGLNGDYNYEDIKSSYESLILKNHPDKVSDLSEDFIDLARKKTKELNTAYAFFIERRD